MCESSNYLITSLSVSREHEEVRDSKDDTQSIIGSTFISRQVFYKLDIILDIVRYNFIGTPSFINYIYLSII